MRLERFRIATFKGSRAAVRRQHRPSYLLAIVRMPLRTYQRDRSSRCGSADGRALMG